MYINFTNLNGGDIETFLRDNTEREVCHMFCEVTAVMTHEGEYKKCKIFVVRATSRSGPDPKLHFKDIEKAKECHDYLANLIACDKSELCTVDALALGAL